MYLHGLVMGDGVGGRAQNLDARGHHRNRGERAGSDDDHAALELIFLHADEVQGHAAPRSRRIQRALVGLDPANTRAPTARQDLDLFTGRERPIDEGPRDDGAETGQCHCPHAGYSGIEADSIPTAAGRSSHPTNG